jgi:tRNA modification GTPase
VTLGAETSTIFALSSGAPPAGIAVIRISGPLAGAALQVLAGELPLPRRATLRTLHDPHSGDVLDRALVLWLPGPNTATGEDLAEIHAHGGRAVVRVIEGALASIAALRLAEPGEFTRRALMHGRIDLTEAEGLADLLSAETDSQRRAALLLSGGALSGLVADWQQRLLIPAAAIEAMLDFSDEEDVEGDAAALQRVVTAVALLAADWRQWLARPTSERLRDGIVVAIAGPPNAGKSTLINALAQREAAIVSPLAGTTRDIVEVPLALDGVAFRFADTAGLHAGTGDAIEAIGMERARAYVAASDILLWLGQRIDAPDHPHCLCIAAQADRGSGIAECSALTAEADLTLSARSGHGMDDLHALLVRRARALLPMTGETALNERHRIAIQDALAAISNPSDDPLLLAEQLRGALAAINRITGAAGTEAMLDTLFGRFCIGK